MEQIYDMIIIGGGPAGYTTALYASRAGFETIVIEKMSAGGQMALTDVIDNYPGFEEGINGFMLGMKMQKSAEQSVFEILRFPAWILFCRKDCFFVRGIFYA